MGFYPQKQKSTVAQYGNMSLESGASLDIESGASFKVAGSAAELDPLVVSAQAMTADGAITIKSGVVTLNKAGVLAATLANPTATTDDYKRLSILSLSAQAHTVTVTGGFGNGGNGEDVASFSGVVGDCLHLIAYGGYWYITGAHQVSVA